MTPVQPEQTGPPQAQPVSRWYHKVWSVLLIAFCLEIGLFLLIFPWTETWDVNYFASSIARVREYWDNMYLRGAVSGLGLINLYISAAEAWRLRRFAKRRRLSP